MAIENQSYRLIFPFSIHIEPMEKLLLINFVKDPDSIYVGFEPQVFNDTINGTGHLVIGWRTDKKVDVYHQKSLHPDPSRYRIAGAGLNKMIPADMTRTNFEVSDSGIQAHYLFHDIAGRVVEIVINEHNPEKRKPFGLLAPMGDAVTNPPSLPLILLHDFYFVRKNHTEIKVSINNRFHKLDELPIPMDGQKMTFTRYSPGPLIASFNPEMNGILEGIEIKYGQEFFEKDDCIYEIDWTDQHAYIKSLKVINDIYPLSITFTPYIPCLNSLTENTSIRGKFNISGHESTGSIFGVYTITSDKDSVKIRVNPDSWKPRITKFSTWFLFNIAKVFKKWPSTYQWHAELQKRSDGSWSIYSKWIRTGKIMKE